VDLYIHSPIRLHGVMLNQLSTRTTLPLPINATLKGTLNKLSPLYNVTSYSYKLDFDIILLPYISNFWALHALSLLFLDRSSVRISQFLYAGYMPVHPIILHLITLTKLDKQHELCAFSYFLHSSVFSYIHTHTALPNITVKWVVLLLYVREVAGSYCGI
jgi:hypothetical protein